MAKFLSSFQLGVKFSVKYCVDMNATCILKQLVKGKVIPLQARCDPDGG